MNFNRPLILASNSPRRRQIFSDAGYTFTVADNKVDESYPPDMPAREVAKYLAHKKALGFELKLKNEVVITADTIVILNNKIIGKPKDAADAIEILHTLSGQMHQVVTGICIFSSEKIELFDDIAEVSFVPLAEEEIRHYVDTYKPFDKAGAYGIQEWIGMIGIQSIHGSFYNVMGLPIHKLYKELKKF
jgi:septum formation protein